MSDRCKLRTHLSIHLAFERPLSIVCVHIYIHTHQTQSLSPPHPLQVGDVRTLVSTDSQSVACVTSNCFKVGVTTINDEHITSVGEYTKSDVIVSLSNSKSFSRVSISSPVIAIKVCLGKTKGPGVSISKPAKKKYIYIYI